MSNALRICFGLYNAGCFLSKLLSVQVDISTVFILYKKRFWDTAKQC